MHLKPAVNRCRCVNITVWTLFIGVMLIFVVRSRGNGRGKHDRHCVMLRLAIALISW